MRSGVGAAVTALCFAAPGPVHAQSTAPPVNTTYFAFHSDPWINLHHFLYQWSRADQGIGTGRQAVEVPERGDLDSLDPEARRAWNSALDFYRANVASRDHFDHAMLELKHGLTLLEGDPAATPPDDIPGVSAALRTAVPVYLTRWWPAHDRANRSWIGTMAPMVKRHEEGFAALAERSYGGSWPRETIRLDASVYGNWAGGYTSNQPTHTVMLSTDPNNGGLRGMETVFHESSHNGGLQRPSRATIAEAADGRDVNRNLSHALIFYTAGWYARQVGAGMGQTDYVPYMVFEGLTGFRGWTGLWEALDAEWPAVLEGRRSRLDAMRAVLGRLDSGP